MLTRVDVLNTRGDTLALPLSDISGGYIVKDIEGLDPVTATLTSTSEAQSDGAQLQNVRRDTRNITAKLGFAPDFSTNTVVSLRRNLYNYLLPKSNVVLSFYEDGAIFAKTSATVESCESSRFSQEPEVDLSLICYDPDFYAPVQQSVSGSTVVAATTTTTTIPYDGTSDAGLIFSLTAPANGLSFTLYNTRPDGTVQIFNAPNVQFNANDVITVNSIPGQKAFTLTRSNTVIPVMYAKDPTSTWPALANGNNQFRAVFTTAGIAYTVKYTSKYAGL